jgi:DNA polymerase-4
MMRTILYAELPNFYASIERADHPEAIDRPVVVGGDPRKRGLVQSASADAQARGVELEMPMLEAVRRCPEARVFRTNMPRYRDVSRQLFAWLRREFDQLEASGLGAAFFDLSRADRHPEEIAGRLRETVHRELGLPLRAGIGSGKLIARLAAEEAGEGGVRRIAEGSEAMFLHPLPVTRLEGVGAKTAATLAELGARTIGELAALGRERLEGELGTHGLRILAFAAGHDDRPVRASGHPRSISREATLAEGSRDLASIGEQLERLAQSLAAELQRQGLFAVRVALKLRFPDQPAATRSLTLTEPTAAAPEIQAAALALLERTDAGSRAVVSLGLQLAGLLRQVAGDRQLDLFSASS